jgi:2,4-dienoyl-CoA reductase-like NADH-dependent reductase (Old Yellow Enzyme family)
LKSVTIKNMVLKNRFVMLPLCMYSAKENSGMVAPFTWLATPPGHRAGGAYHCGGHRHPQ